VFVDFSCGRLLGISVGRGQQIDEGSGYPNRRSLTEEKHTILYFMHMQSPGWLSSITKI
jgi:hypothetical protein